MNIAPDSSLPPLALIAGPTASGKSALAMMLAEQTGGTIVNADSAQVYRDLRVVTARPSVEDEAKATHRLYGYRDGADPCSAAEWAAEARQSIAAVHDAGGLPILVGGTGLYLRTLIDGIAPVPEIDAAIRAEVRALDVAWAHDRLKIEDPGAAARLRPTDTTRVARALEVVRSTGRPLAAWQKERAGGIGGTVALRALLLLPPRAWLYERCDVRFEKIISDEGIEEVRSLLERGFNPVLPVMRAIGVPEIQAVIEGRISREEGLAAGRTATRQYAKRQYTWFSRQPPPEWTRFGEAPEEEAAERALALLAA